MAKKETKKEKNSLDVRVRNAAQGIKLGKFNLRQFADKKQSHIDVCKQLVALSDEFGKYPIGYLVYFAISKNAHRTHVYEDGYKTINVDKARTILEWLKMFSEQNSAPKMFRDANIAHVFCKVYDKVTQNTEDFKNLIAKVPICAKVENFKALSLAMGI